MKRWKIKNKISNSKSQISNQDLVNVLLENRGITTESDKKNFLEPPPPDSFAPEQVGIDPVTLNKAITRIHKAITTGESIVVYADYDADGITAGSIMWETIHALGGKIMPYIPHRVEEGYGFSKAGIENVKKTFNPTLIISVDHGITAWKKIAYAKELGIEVIVTDHHTKPEKLPQCTIVHTTQLCGAGISYFVAKELLRKGRGKKINQNELIALAAIGTIADMVPLVGINRSLAKYGIAAIRTTNRPGLHALIKDAGIEKNAVKTYEISHLIAPKLNAMGRLVHALDALRLLCTTSPQKAVQLASLLGLTNRERQTMTEETLIHARQLYSHAEGIRLIFISHSSYNQGVIGLVAGKLVETFYRPAIVVAQGEIYSKASARSIAGFNIIEAIRACSDLLVDAGGHPMAAGFTVETKQLPFLQKKLEEIAMQTITEEQLTRILVIDMEIPLSFADHTLWETLRQFEPFGIGNSESLFSSSTVEVVNARLIGRDQKHLKLVVKDKNGRLIEAICFNMAEYYKDVTSNKPIDIAYTIDLNEWNGKQTLQLKVKDLRLSV